MKTQPMNRFLQKLRSTSLAQQDDLSDRELLACYASTKDEAAFAALVHRHGPMVLGVCRRVTGNPHDAEDAFQATFLVLVRKAASIRSPELLGNWLYGVALRVAQKAKTVRAKHLVREKPLPMELVDHHTEQGVEVGDLRAMLDKEVHRLPHKYRVPVVLCELEGRSRKEAAQQLRLPEGTLSSRLATARKLLHNRLSRYSAMASSAAIASLFSSDKLSAAVSADLRASTVHAGSQLVAGNELTNIVSAQTITLMKGILRNMKLTQIRNGLLVVLVAGALTLTLGVFFHQALAGINQPAARSSAAAAGANQNLGGGANPQTAPLPKPEPWAGFLANTSLAKLPNPVKVDKNHPFKIGVIQDGKTFANIAQGIKDGATVKGQKPIWPRWGKEIDWQRETVVYVVLTNSTNALAFKGWKTLQGKTAVLMVDWSLIEPFYLGRQYAFFYRIPRGDLSEIYVDANGQHLAKIQLMPK